MVRSERASGVERLYYVHVQAESPHRVPYDPHDILSFEDALERACRSCDASAHAFRWSPGEARFVVQLEKVSLDELIGFIMERDSRAHGRASQRVAAFVRHAEMVLESEIAFLRVIRYLHLPSSREGRAPEDAPGAAEPEDAKTRTRFGWTTHRVYTGELELRFLTTSLVYKLVAQPNLEPCEAYLRFLRTGSIAVDAEEFERSLPHANARGRKPMAHVDYLEALSPLIDAAARHLEVDRSAVVSKSQKRRHSEARALVAWHATQNKVAKLAEVAQVFKRHASALLNGMSYWRSRDRDGLFELPLERFLTGPSTAIDTHTNAPPISSPGNGEHRPD